ncbi:hypothetical protein SAMN04488128_106152 [Chitinophaga eiseniae]|uniref:Lipoprotein n=1 Tax=Chitinophaga eiseniae TaxID=634771 RepID=A0A1T4TSD7_9BACT|nr:hypothetical protein [Chitinophaga eiseniae]SKA43251.1 hypothetical protein SAMN04488128_106152 [Chitinophaga eiseniae]
MKVSHLLLAAGIAVAMLTACGNGAQNNNQDSMNLNSSGTTDTAAIIPDTAPAAQIPPGAINPGEDSARFGTGAGDSSRNPGHKSQ